MNIIPINIPYNTYKHRHYCMEFKDAYILHKDPIINKGIGSGWLKVSCNGKVINIEGKDYEKAG